LLREAPTGLTFNNCTLCPHCIYVFCIYVRTNSDLFHLQHKLIGFYNRDEKCLQRSMDWVFKYSLIVTWCTTSLTFNNCTLCPHCVYVFCIYLRTDSDLCHLRHKLIGFYNQDERCLLCGTDWVFNLLKPNGHVMHHQFNIRQLYTLSTLYLCVLYLSEDKQWLVPLAA